MLYPVPPAEKKRGANGFIKRLILLAASCLVLFWCRPSWPALSSEVISFTDIEEHWAQSTITRLAVLEIVKGYPDCTFKPEQLVSRLETVALVIRSGSFAAEAEKLASSARSKTGARRGKTQMEQNSFQTPRVPWGQHYLDLAAQKGFLKVANPDEFNCDAPATRLEAARLLAHALYLVPPETGSASAPVGGGVSINTVSVSGGEFTDVARLSPEDRICVRSVAASGVMQGYPDNTFRPGQCLTRAEISTILSRLVDLGWVKVAGDRRVEGWISSVQTNGRQQEIEVTSLAGIQKFRAAGGLYCYKNGEKWAVEKSTNFRCEVILDSRKQAGWINLLEPKSSVVDAEKVRGSVKSVALGEESVMVLNDLNCEDKILRIAWDAVVTGKSARQGFKSLKAGDFVDVDLSGGLVRKATVLEVKTVTGTVGRFDGYRMYLEEGMSGNKPGWFNYWDRARVVDRDGLKKGSVLAGDRVEVTYLDPYPEEIDDEIPLQVKVMN